MPPIAITWVGCHEEGLPAFARLLTGGQRISRFITLSEAAFAQRSAGSRAYLDLCEKHGVPVSFVDTIKDDAAYALFSAEPIDLLVVMGWSEILPARLLALPRAGTVGTHAALLPHNRGSAPVNWAIIRGETEGGNSLMWLDEHVDAGAIIDQMAFPITAYDTCKTVYDKVAETNAVMLCRLVRKLAAGETPSAVVENRTDEPLLPRRRPKDGLMNWNAPAKQVYDFIRALTRPYPGAFTFMGGEKHFLWRAALLAGEIRLGQPGEILGAVKSPDEAACGLQVACQTGAVVLHEIEDEQGRVLSGQALAETGLSGCFTNNAE